MASVADILILVFVAVTSSTTMINGQRGTRPGSRPYYAGETLKHVKTLDVNMNGHFLH